MAEVAAVIRVPVGVVCPAIGGLCGNPRRLAPAPAGLWWRGMRSAPFLVLVLTAAFAAEPGAAPTPAVPPSPSTASGERIWPEPRFTHWPALIYADEERNLSFELPVRVSGTPGSVGWEGGAVALPIVLPADTERVSGLMPVPSGFGTHIALLTIADATTSLPLRLADVRQPWPLAALRDGFPVDADGVPTILVDRRRDPASERQWNLLARELPRGTGRPVVVGDPLADLGADAWVGLDAECRPALDDRHPQHAVLVALADLAQPTPRTLVWSPGNGALFGGAWTAEEERVLAAIRSRCAALGAMPRLVLLLPPIPLDPELREQAVERREVLARSAGFQGWAVLDLEAIAGPAEVANRVADGLFTRHPIGPARARITEAIVAELRR
jgi:hypothetical protein